MPRRGPMQTRYYTPLAACPRSCAGAADGGPAVSDEPIAIRLRDRRNRRAPMPGHWVEGSALKESTAASGDGVNRRKRREMLPGTSHLAIHIGKQPEAPWIQRNHPRRRSMYRRVNALRCPGFIGRAREGVQKTCAYDARQLAQRYRASRSWTLIRYGI